MAVKRRALDLLPNIFRTDANRKFLGCTLDQLINEPEFRKLNGYVGRLFGPNSLTVNNYLVESSDQRQNYQLEPGLVVKDSSLNINLYGNYIDLINKIQSYGGIVDNHNRLFESDFYTFDPQIDLDKFVNYSQYYWLPVGPEIVNISSRPLTTNSEFVLSYVAGSLLTNQTGTTPNPTIILQRGETYSFSVPTPSGNLWIQTEPGQDGKKDYAIGANTRSIYGVFDNGSSNIRFAVPEINSENRYYTIPTVGYVDYALSEQFTAIDNAVYKSTAGVFLTLSGETFYPNDCYVIFIQSSSTSADWTDRNGAVVPTNQRRGIWQIKLHEDPAVPGEIRIHLKFVRSLTIGDRVEINSSSIIKGRRYSLNSSNQFVVVNDPTSALSTLYYQNDILNISGMIKIVDRSIDTINVTNDIIGKVNYTSPQGIVFTNGLRIRFDDTVSPANYRNKIYFVEGVGKSITLVDFSTLIIPELNVEKISVPYDFINFDQGLYDESIDGSLIPDYIVCNRASIDRNAWSRVNRWVHIDVIKKSLEYNNLPFLVNQNLCAKRPIIEFKPNLQLFNSGKKFHDIVDKFYSAGQTIRVNNRDVALSSINQILNQTYRTIKNYGLDLVGGDKFVLASDRDSSAARRIYRAEYLDQSTATLFTGILPGTLSARKSQFITSGTGFTHLLEIGDDIFYSDNTHLGRVRRILSDNEIQLDRSIAFSFANELGLKFLHARLLLVVVNTASDLDIVVTRKGKNIGKSYYFTGIWQEAQRKTQLNQAPLFDIVTENGQSLKDAYPFSSFAGSPLFSYAAGSRTADPVLGLNLEYTGIGDFIGDISFVNNYARDSFTYRLQENSSSISKKIDTGYIKRLVDNSLLDEYLTMWTKTDYPSRQYQLITGVYDGLTCYFETGIRPYSDFAESVDEPMVKIYINNKPIVKTTLNTSSIYTLEQVGVRQTIRINPSLLVKGDKVDILIHSDEVSQLGHYQIPLNLEYNADNKDIVKITLGQIRQHLVKISQNIKGLVGDALASNNFRDLDYSKIYGTLLQHSASVLPGMAFLLDNDVNFISSLDYARREYTRFKNRFVETINQLDDLLPDDPRQSVDKILAYINQVKGATFPWYYSDMVGSGNRYLETNFVVQDVGQIDYRFSQNYYNEYTQVPSNKCLLVYVNQELLIRNVSYTIQNESIIRISKPLVVGDRIRIHEYLDTNGSFIPDTPTKLGLYPKFIPSIFFDSTYREPINVIQGHDGSLIPAFNDFRDHIILELEKRIYNNIKVEYRSNIFDINSFIPGKFRTTDYTLDEFNQVLTKDFLKWVGSNQVDYSTNRFFLSNDPYSYNYNRSYGADSSNLPGGWRGIYKYYFDTDRPHTAPWEMLGHSIKPAWWDSNYSWTDTVKRTALILAVSNGLVSNPGGPIKIDLNYARPGFSALVPVDNLGNLIDPLRIVVHTYNSETFSRSFSVGDHGPAESAWRKSSEYPFALQRTLALLKPARYFGLLWDIARYRYSPVLLDQIVDITTGKRSSFKDIKIDDNVSASYINWIRGFLTGLGLDPVKKISAITHGAQLNLSYKIGGFTDKQYITVLSEQFSPGSINQSVVLPDENYHVYLSKSVPVRRAIYSAVIVQKTNQGWTVTGYDQKYPFFTVIPSVTTGTNYVIDVLGTRAVIYNEYRKEKLTVPYGFEFTSKQQVVNFLVAYERYLKAQGFRFETYDLILEVQRDWVLSAREFLTWTLQGWPEGNILILSPILDKIILDSSDSTVDTINSRINDSRLLGVNFNTIKNTEIQLLRDNGVTTISSLSGQTLAYADLSLVQFEHVLIFDNITVFNDVVYQPESGSRQFRLKIVGTKTDLWDGELTPAGFIYNNGIVADWLPGTDYRKGDIARYKNKNYTALKDLAASTTFDFAFWSLLDTKIISGLASNFAQNATVFNNIYDIDNQPLNETFAQFSNALIGYRSRQHFEDLGIDQTAQTKFYQGYIRDKGTRLAINAISKGRFDNENNEIVVYEEWGARIGEYGAIDANPELYIRIKESVYNSNPINIELLQYNEVSDSVLFKKLYPNHLWSKTLDYKPQIFLDRPACPAKTWKIELFGDGLLCGKKADNIFRYSILLGIQNAEFGLYKVQVFLLTNNTFAVSVAPNDTIEIRIDSIFNREILYYEIDEISAVENPLSIGPLIILNFTVTSVDPNENLIYRVVEVTDDSQPSSTTGIDSVVACRYNQSAGRVDFPVDFLLYSTLSSEFGTAITTRSVTGSDSTQLLSGLDGVNQIWPDDIEADIVLINHGHNDAKNNIPLNIYTRNLEALRNRLSYSVKIIWVLPTEVDFAVSTWANTTSFPIDDYAKVMKQVANKFGDYVADTRKIRNWRSLLDIDGIHPTQEGYRVLVSDILVPVIKQVITDYNLGAKKYYEDDLQSGGYPLIHEVDGRYFDIVQYSKLTILNELYSYYKLWVAKDFNRDWQVYRAYLQDNLIVSATLETDNKFVLTCTRPHKLLIGDLVAIRNFDSTLDGFYQVSSLDRLSFSVYGTADTTAYLISNTVEERTGELFDFERLRFSTYNDLLNYKPKHPWFDQRFYSIQGIDPAVECYTMNEFAAKFSQIYNHNAQTFEQAAWEILPLYVSNRPFNLVMDGRSVTRYGLYRTVDPDGLAYWTNNFINLGYNIENNDFLVSFFTAVTTYVGYDRDLTSNKKFDNFTLDLPGCSLFRYRGSGNTTVVSTLIPGDKIKFNVTGIDKNETLVYRILTVTGTDYSIANTITKSANLTSTSSSSDLGRDLLYVDKGLDTCGSWVVLRPSVRTAKYRLASENTITYSNVYSIISADCTAVDCYTIDDFSNKFAEFNSRNVADFKAKASELLPLFTSNQKFLYIHNGKTYIRYGLFGTVSTNELFSLTDFALVNTLGITDGRLLAVFFSYHDDKINYSRHLTNLKEFLSTTDDVAGCSLFADRGSTSFFSNSTITFCFTSVEPTENLFYSIEQVTGIDLGATITRSGNLITYSNESVIELDPEYDFSIVRIENPIVDIDSVNNMYVYSDKDKRKLVKLDLLDPAKGRILGVAQQDLDYTTSIDPARYRVGLSEQSDNLPINDDSYWGNEQVGTYWWNVDAVRYIHYEQSSLDYRSQHWGEFFPGSEIQVYEWIESDYLPSLYRFNGGDGIPRYDDDTAYSESVYIDSSTNMSYTKYFYWVRNKKQKTSPGKRHSTATLEDMITRPINQNIPYMLPFRNNSFGLCNIGTFLKGSDAVFYVSSQRKINQNIIHSDFALVQEGNPHARIPGRIEKKIIDSVIGKDIADQRVPDPRLTGTSKFGLEIRPRQTVIANVKRARENLVKWVNSIFKQYAVANRVYDRLSTVSDNFFAKEDLPKSSQYDSKVDNYSSLSVVPIIGIGQSKNILVESDESIGGYWAIYQLKRLSNNRYTKRLIKRQSYDVSKLWSFVDWYASDFSQGTTIDYVVNNISETYKLKLRNGDVVRINNNTTTYPKIGAGTVTVPGKFEIYRYVQIGNELQRRLIGLEKGTIEISKSLYLNYGFDTEPIDSLAFDFESSTEFRYILKGLKENIFIEDLEHYFDAMLYYMIDYILSEQLYIDWFFKTSFVSVFHKTDSLTQYPSYIRDRHSNFEDYVNEVKPYRTKIRQYVLSYRNLDLGKFTLTDFDLPAYYDEIVGKFRSPNGEFPAIDQQKLGLPEYQSWAQNYKYTLDNLEIASKGHGYFTLQDQVPVSPDVVIIRREHVPNPPQLIAIFGDGVSTYGGLTIDSGLDPLVAANYELDQTGSILSTIKRLYPNDTVVNVSRTWMTTDEALTGVQTYVGPGLSNPFGSSNTITQWITDHKPAKIVLRYGLADAVLMNNATASLANIDTIINHALARNIEVILVGVNPAAAVGSLGNGMKFGSSYTALMENTALLINNGILNKAVAGNLKYANPRVLTVPAGALPDGIQPLLSFGIEITNEIYRQLSLVIPQTATAAGTDAAAYVQLKATTGGIEKVYMTSIGSNYTETPLVRVQGNGTIEPNDSIIYHYRAVSRGSANSSLINSGLYNLASNTTVLSSALTGDMVMHRIRRVDGKVELSRFYATSVVDDIEQLTFDLRTTSNDYVVVVYVVGYADSTNRLINGLDSAMYRCGASKEIYGSVSNWKTGSAYILVGIPGSGPGRGLENYSGITDSDPNAYAMIEFKLRLGRLIPIDLSPRVYRLSTAFAFPSSPTVDQIYKYGARSWKYNGKRWIQITTATTQVGSESEARRAVLVPRLANHTIRKIKTVIKFDRIQYGTDVMDWEPGQSYSIGTYLSHKGQGYIVKKDMPSSDNFIYAFVKPIGVDEPATAISYRHGLFDNSNDRIMSFYVPTVDNLDIPKDLGRLVTGTQDAWTTYNSTTKSIPLDTNLSGDVFGSNRGVEAGSITVVGGQFIDLRASHAPEELVPGIMFDAISIKTVTSTGVDEGFRIFVNMTKDMFITDFDSTSVTTLAQSLEINDTVIIVMHGSRLSTPNPTGLIPGIIEVNGERISYYTKVGNVLGQIRRGYGGTGILQSHQINSRVEDVSVPGVTTTLSNTTPIW